MRFLVFLISLTAAAQDPYQLAPRNYIFDWENPHVRVSRVRYQPGDKIPVHDHPAVNTVYVYLTDGGPIRFGHQEFEGITRPAVKAGAIRFARGNKETHDTAYLGDQPSEYLRIELRTATTPAVRSARIAAGESGIIENDQVRIFRCGPCPTVNFPTVAVSLAAGKANFLAPRAATPQSPDHILILLKTEPR